MFIDIALYWEKYSTMISYAELMCFPAFIFDVDTSTTLEDDLVAVMLNDSYVENPTTFVSTLLYGSCPDYVTFPRKPSL